MDVGAEGAQAQGACSEPRGWRRGGRGRSGPGRSASETQTLHTLLTLQPVPGRCAQPPAPTPPPARQASAAGASAPASLIRASRAFGNAHGSLGSRRPNLVQEPLPCRDRRPPALALSHLSRSLSRRCGLSTGPLALSWADRWSCR